MTGIPAWERAAPDHPMQPGKVKLQEFEYIRHGACGLIANWDVAQGQVVAPSLSPVINFQKRINESYLEGIE